MFISSSSFLGFSRTHLFLIFPLKVFSYFFYVLRFIINMDSANLHQQQQQQQQERVNKLVGSTSSSSPLPTQSYSYGGAAAGSNLAWTTPNNLILNNSLIPNLNGFINQRGNDDFTPDHQMPQNNLWASSSKMKEGFSISSSDTNFPKFTEMLSDEHVDLSEKLLLKTISASGFHFNGHDQLGDHHLYSNASYGRPGSFSQIYPSINVSSLSQSDSDQSAFSSSSSLDMNLQALDLLNNARFSDHSPGNFVASTGFGHQMQQSLNHSCSLSNKVQRAATEAKRSSSLAEPLHTPKKSRLDSRPSCPPLKVRKEKLGDRIAALQQLVAPFGKTDTASVLMEAIGYIQFLQNQVKTLSVPYMKSWRNRSCRPMQEVPNEEGNEETRRDLRSRGLCLVPLSCVSYVANVDSGGCEGVWPPPPNFGASSTLR